MSNLNTRPHRRFNPLTGRWILVSPHRLQRPWQGQTEAVAAPSRPRHDPNCYLCPGNPRAGGLQNPDYASTYAFDNDYPALLPHESAESGAPDDRVLLAEPERGICRVVCFSPRHDLSLAHLPVEQIRAVVDTWAHETETLARNPWVRYVQVFENKGEMMGCSNPHPHGQIWASESIPNEPAGEGLRQWEWYEREGRTLLSDIVRRERQAKERIVFDNGDWLAIVPFWAEWPFEVLLVHAAPVASLVDLDARGRDQLADALGQVTSRYDRLFGVSFPYTMGFHQAPVNAGAQPWWHLHAHFYPPLLRSATVRKFMVGFEMLGMPQRDILPEAAAQRLRDQ
jgi:UDPglucose--hexose-1-phosphate uridylyltransferase